MGARILLVSPTPTHPQNQGNSMRIYAIGRMLQAAGMTVHFLYYQLEGLTAGQKADMEACWDYFHPIPVVPKDMRPTGGDAYNLDDWWQPAVGEVARQLHRRWHFQAVIANYVWFSGVLKVFGADVVKVLDTHDLFGGRAERFRQAGLEPEWYYTTDAEEARGLQRADIVLAIQNEEAAAFEALGHRNVRVLGHVIGLRHRQPRQQDTRPIVAGFLASGNPINVVSFERMRQRLVQCPTKYVQFVLAGTVCSKLASGPDPFRSLGGVDHCDDFYDLVDVVLNPMAFGTGLKIKSVEAIFEGKPLVATTTAMAGLPIMHRLHDLTSPEEVAERVVDLKPNELLELADASRQCAAAYAAEVYAACRALVTSMDGR
jgi:hypothetical protein